LPGVIAHTFDIIALTDYSSAGSLGVPLVACRFPPAELFSEFKLLDIQFSKSKDEEKGMLDVTFVKSLSLIWRF